MTLRQEKILELLIQYNKITIKELGSLIQASLNTVRNDLNILEQQQLVIKTHGKVQLSKVLSKLPCSIRNSLQYSEKQYIASLAYRTISQQANLSLFIDDSTTVLEFVKLLQQYSYPITIISNFIGFTYELSRSNSVITSILCGGTWWQNENCTYGEGTINELKKYYPDISVLGCSGIQLNGDVFIGNPETYSVKQTMQEHSKETWLLADHSKFGRSDLIKAQPLTTISKLFTDKKPSPEWIEYFDKYNIKIYY